MPRVLLLEPEPAQRAPTSEREPEPRWTAMAAPPSALALAIEFEAGPAERPRAPRDLWLVPAHLGIVPPAIGFEGALRSLDGAVWLVRLDALSEHAAQVTIAGSGERRRVPLAEIAALSPIAKAHSFADRMLVISRQRRGEPGAATAPRPPLRR